MGPPQTHEVNTNTTIGTSSSSTAAGLAASPMPLAGALRPLRTPNLGSTSSGTGAGGNVGLLVASAAIDNRAGGNTPAAAVLSLGTSAAHGSSQERIKEENRRALAVEGVLTPRASRPVSANKKFLSKYNLEKLNLFAP